MTEAVAGMTAWALATRGGTREGGGGCAGVRTEGKGGDCTPPRWQSLSPLTPAALEPLPFAPKTKMEAPSQAGEAAASRS